MNVFSRAYYEKEELWGILRDGVELLGMVHQEEEADLLVLHLTVPAQRVYMPHLVLDSGLYGIGEMGRPCFAYLTNINNAYAVLTLLRRLECSFLLKPQERYKSDLKHDADGMISITVRDNRSLQTTRLCQVGRTEEAQYLVEQLIAPEGVYTTTAFPHPPEWTGLKSPTNGVWYYIHTHDGPAFATLRDEQEVIAVLNELNRSYV